jgi:prevent-host-death family protein
MIIQENMHYAKTHFSELVKRALSGDQVVIAKAGNPLVQLIPYQQPASSRTPGSASGRFEMGSDFDKPLPSDELESWGL